MSKVGDKVSSISVEDVWFSYDHTEVLHGLSLEVQAGEQLALLGPNGAGKSTLIELIIGTLRPQSGKVTVLDQNPAQPTDQWLARLGVTAQSSVDRPKWVVRDFLAWVRAHYQVAGRQCLSVDEALEKVGLVDKRRSLLGGISGGQRRRVDIAAAIIAHPDLLVLDEPTTGLDPASKRMIHDLLAEFSDRGTTVVLSTHDLNEAQKVADRVVVVNLGKLVFDGSAQQLRDRVGDHAEVTWVKDGRRYVHSTQNVEEFIHELDMDGVSNLEVTRPDLEDAYLDLLDSEMQGGVS